MKKEKRLIIFIIVILLVVAVISFLFLSSKKSHEGNNNDNYNNINNKINTITKYQYIATLNENMINYNLEIIDGNSLNGELFSIDGEWLSDLVDGKAIINEIDYDKYDSFKIRVNDEVYEIEKK